MNDKENDYGVFISGSITVDDLTQKIDELLKDYENNE